MSSPRLVPILFTLALIPSASIAADDRCMDLLMTYEQQRELAPETWHAQIESPGGGSLFYFGASHTDDPRHPMFAEIDAAWKEHAPTMVFFEGPDRGTKPTREETIAAFGESGYVRFLASRSGVETRSLEPSPVGEYEAMIERFPADQVQIFYITREAVRLRDRKDLHGEELESAIAQLIERARALFTGSAAELTLESYADSYAEHFGTHEWWTASADWFDPLRKSEETGGIFTNEINRASSEYRNQHMARTLGDAIRGGARVFAVVGRNHVPAQAAALECLAVTGQSRGSRSVESS